MGKLKVQRTYTTKIVRDRIVAESDRAVAEGMTLKDFCEGKGYRYMSVWQWRRRRTPAESLPWEAYEKRRRRIIKLFELGVTIGELSKLYDIAEPAICRTLDNEGYDAEAREKMRAKFDEDKVLPQGADPQAAFADESK